MWVRFGDRCGRQASEVWPLPPLLLSYPWFNCSLFPWVLGGSRFKINPRWHCMTVLPPKFNFVVLLCQLTSASWRPWGAHVFPQETLFLSHFAHLLWFTGCTLRASRLCQALIVLGKIWPSIRAPDSGSTCSSFLGLLCMGLGRRESQYMSNQA